jgi:Family of unknown function (DUF6847)
VKRAEDLASRAECQRRLEQLKKRLIRNAKVQEGEEPAEDPKGLLDSRTHRAFPSTMHHRTCYIATRITTCRLAGR